MSNITKELTTAEVNKLDEILQAFRAEVLRARKKHKPMNSPHEGYAVLKEEVDELWDEVKADNGREITAMEEATQVAAMGVRYVMDLSPSIDDPTDIL